MEKVHFQVSLLVVEGELREKVQPRGSKRGLSWILLCGTSSKRKLCMVPCHISHIQEILRSKEVRGCFKVIIWGDNASYKGQGVILMGKESSRYVRLLYWNFIVSLTGYCKRFYRIPLFLIFLLFYLFCIYWDWQGQKCKLKCPKVYKIYFELYCNFNFFLYPFLWYKDLYPQLHKKTFVATENL